jgi:Kef-type K+ transport system membrane component KefB
VTFGTLALIIAAGLAGPLLNGWRPARVPLVVGEIAAGVVVGNTGFGWIDASEPTLAFLAQVGFAMLMFVVGTHLPLRDPRLRPALSRAVAATAATFAVGAPVAYGLSRATSVHRTGLLLVLISTSSAAVALPIVAERGLDGADVLATTAWIAAGDVASIAAVPIVVEPRRALRVVAGAVVVTMVALAVWRVAAAIRHRPIVHRLRESSKRHAWALDLRLSLIGLFVLAWLADRFGTGILVAGFSAGAIVALVGEPKRLAQQLLGLADGFFVPLFFVSLGARLDVRGLLQSPHDLTLAAALAGSALALHMVVAAGLRLPLAAGLLADAQLGVPAAVAAIGLQRQILTAGQAAAVIAAALASLAACASGAALLARRQQPHAAKR